MKHLTFFYFLKEKNHSFRKITKLNKLCKKFRIYIHRDKHVSEHKLVIPQPLKLVHWWRFHDHSIQVFERKTLG